jgi:hypothetical protein
MNRLLVALIAGAFAFISASAFADDSSMMPLSKMDTEQAKAARQAAQEKWAKMTPQEQAAARKSARAKKLSDANAIDMVANENMMYNAKAGAAATAASKEVAKPTKEERKADTKAATKATTGQ